MISGTFRRVSTWVLQEESAIVDSSTTVAEHLSAYSIGRQMLYSAIFSCAGSVLIQAGWTTASGMAAFTACSAIAVYALSVPLLLHFFADNEQRVSKLSYHLWKAGCTGCTLLTLGVQCHWGTLGSLAAGLFMSLLKLRDGYSIYRIPIFLIFLKR